MARFTRGLVVTLGVVLLGLFVTIVSQKPALGQNGNIQPVLVTNKTVPTTVTNTPLPISGSVSVGNFPATQNVNVTNASLPVTGIVTANINGTPNVNATITNSSLSALITNPTNNPVLVSNLNDSFDHEFSVPLCEMGQNPPIVNCASPTPYGSESFSVFNIPATTLKGLPVTAAVIEFVTGFCEANASNDITAVSLNTPGPGGTQYWLVPVRTTPSTFPVGFSNWTFSQTTKIYAYPGNSIAIFANTVGGINTSGQECFAQVAGTLLTQ